jgi:hypothetical protein
METLQNFTQQIKALSTDDLILFDLIINIWPNSEIESILQEEKIKFNWSKFSSLELSNLKSLVKIHLKLRNVEIV